jgi:hypothetical protein
MEICTGREGMMAESTIIHGASTQHPDFGSIRLLEHHQLPAEHRLAGASCASTRPANRRSTRSTLLKLSPINSIDKVKGPLLILQCANDPRVPVGEALQMHAALEQRGLPSSLISCNRCTDRCLSPS